MLSARPLFSLTRGGHEEVCALGEVVVDVGDGSPFRSGDGGSRFPARSLLKPFQFLATGLAQHGADPLPASRVPALGSISGTPEQLGQLHRWYADDPLQQHLDLPCALPLSAEGRALRVASGVGPSRSCHPCFSKHMAILAACQERGWPLAGYTGHDHPFHHELIRTLETLLPPGHDVLSFVTDGCHLPTPALGALELARLYRSLAAAPDASPLGRLRRAMSNAPGWIGGPERVDTRLMLLNPGQVVAKEGADGLLAIAVAPREQAPDGAGIVIKLASGHQPAWAALASAPFLEALGLQPLVEATPGQDIVWHVQPGRAPAPVLDISPLLSERVAVWPGDTPFRRTPLTEPGSSPEGSGPAWELLVSSIHTTLHVGAHADAPCHFQIGAASIDRVPLALYRGLCQVIEVSVAAGASIVPADLAGRRLSAPRLLFKTGSFPDPERFEPGFAAFSPELIEWLAAQDVRLIGIDTPSVDPFSSKTLPSHHATRGGRGMAILEGLDLSQVTPGEYELVALPLRLEGADASPVRAALWPLR